MREGTVAKVDTRDCGWVSRIGWRGKDAYYIIIWELWTLSSGLGIGVFGFWMVGGWIDRWADWKWWYESSTSLSWTEPRDYLWSWLAQNGWSCIDERAIHNSEAILSFGYADGWVDGQSCSSDCIWNAGPKRSSGEVHGNLYGLQTVATREEGPTCWPCLLLSRGFAHVWKSLRWEIGEERGAVF